jgi:acyl-CoA reductase-like NAD-dependent aldehyde dehydrogenase
MAQLDYSNLVAGQRDYFLAGNTRPLSWRKAQLEAVKAMFTEHHDELCDALWQDLRRNVIDAETMDVTYNVKEADYALEHLGAWMKPLPVHTPLVFEPGHVRIRRDRRVTLIIGAWNEPFMLRLRPAGSHRRGNTAVLKPSEMACGVRGDRRSRWFPVLRHPGGRGGRGRVPRPPPARAEVGLHFFTGSPAVGKIVHQAAAKT